MANTYNPAQLGIKPDTTGGTWQNGAWYKGRQYYNGTLSDVGVIHPESSQVGAGQAVSAEVNAQSAAAQGVSVPQFNTYLNQQRSAQPAAATAMAGGESGMNGAAGIPAGGGGSGFSGTAIATPATPNLQNIYDQAYKDAGINQTQAEIDAANNALIEASGYINENPYFAEATRTGRIAKLEDQANKKLTVLTNQLNSKKADVDTKLGIATKQFDINQSASSAALTQFNTLLSAGALDSANASDIASFATAVGLPTSFIQSAVNLNKAKNVESKLIESTDDNGNVTVSLVQIKDGAMTVVGKQSLGKIAGSKSTTASQASIKSSAISAAAQILDSLKNDYGHVSPSDWATVRSAALQSGLTTQDFNNNFAAYTDPNRSDFSSSYGFDVKSRGASQYQILGQE